MTKQLISGRSAFVVGLAIAAVVGSTVATHSEDLPKSGEFHLRYTLVNPTTSAFGPVARGDGATAGRSVAGGWVAWLMRDDGSDGFGHKMTGSCTEFFRQSTTGFDMVEGDCVYVDQDGDKLYEAFDGLKGTWTGGTGKYAGLNGTLDLTDIVITVENGYEMQSGVKVGNYAIK